MSPQPVPHQLLQPPHFIHTIRQPRCSIGTLRTSIQPMPFWISAKPQLRTLPLQHLMSNLLQPWYQLIIITTATLVIKLLLLLSCHQHCPPSHHQQEQTLLHQAPSRSTMARQPPTPMKPFLPQTAGAERRMPMPPPLVLVPQACQLKWRKTNPDTPVQNVARIMPPAQIYQGISKLIAAWIPIMPRSAMSVVRCTCQCPLYPCTS